MSSDVVRPTGPWHAVPMLEAPDLHVQALPGGQDGFTAFARFSPGWTRTASVTCTAAEDFVVLEGALELDGVVHRPGSLVRVPAGAERSSTSSGTGCLALAWFDAAPRWQAGSGSVGSSTTVLDLHEAPDGLVATTGDTHWLLHARVSGEVVEHDGDLVDLDDPGWRRLRAGELLPTSAHRHLQRSAAAAASTSAS